jgi:hypothetical protein
MKLVNPETLAAALAGSQFWHHVDVSEWSPREVAAAILAAIPPDPRLDDMDLAYEAGKEDGLAEAKSDPRLAALLAAAARLHPLTFGILDTRQRADALYVLRDALAAFEEKV